LSLPSDGVVGIGLSILLAGLVIGLIYNAVRAAQARWKKKKGVGVTTPQNTVEQRLRPTHCLQCKGPISKRSTYTFFCSKDCAAKWGDDEAMIRALKVHLAEQKKRDNHAA
jgi:hypothetical protein